MCVSVSFLENAGEECPNLEKGGEWKEGLWCTGCPCDETVRVPARTSRDTLRSRRTWAGLANVDCDLEGAVRLATSRGEEGEGECPPLEFRRRRRSPRFRELCSIVTL